MRNDVKDVKNCRQRNHMVPRADIVKLYSDDGKTWRNVCIECRDIAMAGRVKAKQNASR